MNEDDRQAYWIQQRQDDDIMDVPPEERKGGVSDSEPPIWLRSLKDVVQIIKLLMAMEPGDLLIRGKRGTWIFDTATGRWWDNSLAGLARRVLKG